MSKPLSKTSDFIPSVRRRSLNCLLPQGMVGYAFHYKNNHRHKEERDSAMEGRKPPSWLQLLLRNKFFGSCDEHRDLRKSEMNIYCIDCNQCMCPHCLTTPSSPHRLHRLLQIRRYVYQDVIRIQDIQKHLDCSKVQPYTVNSAKVLLLNPRRQSKPSKVSGGGGATCEICGKTVMEHYSYCSIACKVSDVAEVTAISIPEDGGSDDTRSGPSLPSLTSEQEDDSPCLSSLQPSDSSEENRDHWMSDLLSPRRKVARRKGYPRRAPIF